MCAIIILLYSCKLKLSTVTTDVTALSNSYFGDGEGPYHLSGLSCSGHENTLLDCSRSSSTIGYHTCSPGNDTGVRCDGIRFIVVTIHE